jgi:signal peptidase II
MKTTRALIAILVLLGTIGCDQVTKRVAATGLQGVAGQSYLGDTLRLQYAENPGAFLGLGSGLPDTLRWWLLTLGPAAVLAGILVSSLSRRWTRTQSVGLMLVVGGGGSNLIDRAVSGAVVDFLNLGIGPLRTGIFNVADVALLAGLALTLLGAAARGRSGGAGEAPVD